MNDYGVLSLNDKKLFFADFYKTKMKTIIGFPFLVLTISVCSATEQSLDAIKQVILNYEANFVLLRYFSFILIHYLLFCES